MDYKQAFNERKETLNEYFVSAMTLGKSLEKYQDVINVEQLVDTLQEHQKKWVNNRFEIVVVGEFSTGKSTFINALLQREILPSKVTPTTATVNFIRSIDELENRTSDEPIAKVVYMENNREEIIPYEQLADYVTEMSEKEDVSTNIHHVDLYVDSPYLQNGVVIVDTPGLQALNPAHEKITREQIKKSNASIILFNMEQQGKQTEFKFLQSLKESIDRIFFVSNRLDAIPKDEVDEVVEQLRTTLEHNDYQTIPGAEVFPVSALQALKARDASVTTKYWNDMSTSDLLEESRFTLFEQRLERYLFDGEQAEDFLSAPYEKIKQFYDELLQQFEDYQRHLESNDNLEEIEQQFQRAKEEAEIRNMQLKQDVIRLKSAFNDTVRSNEKSYNEALEKVIHDIKAEIETIEMIEDLEDGVNDELIYFNTRHQQLFDDKIKELATNINELMRKEIEAFELKIEQETPTSAHHIHVNIQQTKVKSREEIMGEVTQQFAEREAEMNEARALLKEKMNKETELRYKLEEKQAQDKFYQDDIRFQEMLVQSTPQTKEKYGVIKARKFWFDKTGMIEETNDMYEERVQQQRMLKKEREQALTKLRTEEQNLVAAIAQNEGAYTSFDELRDDRRALSEQKNAALRERLNAQLHQTDRQLQQQRRKVLREFDTIANNAKREYRSFLRELNTLEVAKQKIDDYIQNQDTQLIEAEQRAKRLEQQKMQSETERTNLAAEIETIRQKIEEELDSLALTQI